MDYEEELKRPFSDNVYELPRSGRWAQDRAFDGLLPDDIRVRSALHFTPMHVAERAARWIDELGIRTVVDIGSGAGKFCVVAALASKASFVGFEQRARLVESSRQLASHFGLQARVRFVHGVLGHGELPSAEAYYMYNPFGENLFGPASQIDNDLEPCERRYESDVRLTERLLTELPVGTYLITYNGFGGRVPGTFRCVRRARDLPNELEIWRQGT
jgi:SAM-dependent methyltransferase